MLENVFINLVAQALICYGGLWLAWRWLGQVGLVVYLSLGICFGNIQALLAVDIAGLSQPFVLGGVLFASFPLCCSLLSETYGEQAAKQAVQLSLASFAWVVASFYVLLRLVPSQHPWFVEHFQHIQAICAPMPGVLAASCIAYAISQYTDVFAFNGLKRYRWCRALWIRTLLAAAIAIFIDQVIFSLLAWRAFTQTNLSLATLWGSYIFTPFLIRVGCTLFGLPFLYSIRHPNQPLNVKHAN